MDVMTVDLVVEWSEVKNSTGVNKNIKVKNMSENLIKHRVLKSDIVTLPNSESFYCNEQVCDDGKVKYKINYIGMNSDGEGISQSFLYDSDTIRDEDYKLINK